MATLRKPTRLLPRHIVWFMAVLAVLALPKPVVAGEKHAGSECSNESLANNYSGHQPRGTARKDTRKGASDGLLSNWKSDGNPWDWDGNPWGWDGKPWEWSVISLDLYFVAFSWLAFPYPQF